MEKDQSHLRLLPTPPPGAGREATSVQSTLFPMAASGPTVAYAHMGSDKSKTLIELLDWLRPRWVIDLRPLPRFDFGTLNRKKAFFHFHRVAAAYHDLYGTLGFRTRSEAATHLDTVADAVARIVEQNGTNLGPVLVLVDDDLSADQAAYLPKRLSETSSGKKWEMLVVSDGS